MLRKVAGQCVVETALAYGFHRSGDLTAQGESITAMLDANPETHAVLAFHRLAATPTALDWLDRRFAGTAAPSTC
ncbi:hypothetical protein [Amycolatopsis speibonae]|uniref:Uncharacterized protein n=1 Tax=Amycolatopsis speibonae TaxID=1450224 RepID=A0ABV7P1L2_9PSEU